MSDTRRILNARDLACLFGRSLLIQASWSYERMQSLGFAFSMEPVLRKLYPEQAEYESRLRQHLSYFNTHPYLAAFILGAAVRLEEDRAAGAAVADAASLKSSTMAPLGALGDSFFWGALKPVTAAVSVAMLLAGAWWAPILFLVLFSAGHLPLRIRMLLWGYQTGGDAVAIVAKFNFTRMAQRFKITTLAVLGGMVGMVPFWREEFRPVVYYHPDVFLPLSGLALLLCMVVLLRRGGSPIRLMLALAVLCILLAYWGVIA